jgi:hypothetical protein
MQTPLDLIARHQQEMAEQVAADERAYRSNVTRFVEMFLSLGADVVKIAEGTRFDGQLTEAKGQAAWRWNQLIGMEQQIVREEQQLALRPKKRPAQPGDEVVPDRTLAQRDAQWLDETKHRRDALAGLREQAKRERRELESYIKSRR